jgi:glutamyl/glutaminyl-tRNA synthetase
LRNYRVNPELISTNKQLKKLSSSEIKKLLETSLDALTESDFSVENLQTVLNQLLQSTQQKPAILFSLIRIATTQSPSSPGLADTMAILGKEVSINRIKTQISSLESNSAFLL